PRDARAVERRDPANQALTGHEDRPDVLLPPLVAERAPLRLGRVREPLPGPAGADGVALVPELPPHGCRRDRGWLGGALSARTRADAAIERMPRLRLDPARANPPVSRHGAARWARCST